MERDNGEGREYESSTIGGAVRIDKVYFVWRVYLHTSSESNRQGISDNAV